MTFDEDILWLDMVLERVRSDLDSLCSSYGVFDLCRAVIDSLIEVCPTWFIGKKKRTIVASILYLSLLLSGKVKRGVLSDVLESVGVSKVSVREAISRFLRVDWDIGVLYLDVKLYKALSSRVRLPDVVAPSTHVDVVRLRLSKEYPGLYEFLEILCRRIAKRDCISLLFEDPAKLRDILLERYGETVIARRIAGRFLSSVAEALKIDLAVERLVDLFFKNPEELKRVLSGSSIL